MEAANTLAKLSSTLELLSPRQRRQLCAEVDSVMEKALHESKRGQVASACEKAKGPAQSCLLLDMAPDVIALILSMLTAKDIMRVSCVSTYFREEPPSVRPQTVVERALRQRAGALGILPPPTTLPLLVSCTQNDVSTWARHIETMETLLLRSCLVAGKYGLRIHATPEINPAYNYNGVGELFLNKNGSCHGFTTETSQRGDIPSRIEGGRWTKKSIEFTYIYGSNPHPYSYRVELDNVRSSRGVATVELRGTWRNTISNHLNERGIVASMILRGPILRDKF